MTIILNLLMKAFGVSDGTARLIAWGVAAAVVLSGVGWHAVSATLDTAERVRTAHSDGVAEGTAAERTKWQNAADEERQRQAAANAAAIATAEREAATLRQERDALAQTLEELSHDAEADPGRDDVVLGPDSLRRVNRLRRR